MTTTTTTNDQPGTGRDSIGQVPYWPQFTREPFASDRARRANRAEAEAVRREPMPVPAWLSFDQMAAALSKRLGIKAEQLAAMLTLHVKHSPPGYSRDLAQDIALAWLEAKPATGVLAYGIARKLTWLRWRAWHTQTHRVALSLDDLGLGVGDGRDAEWSRLADYVGAAVEFESLVIGLQGATTIWAMMPEDIRRIVAKRLSGAVVKGWDSHRLKLWAAAHAVDLLAA